MGKKCTWCGHEGAELGFVSNGMRSRFGMTKWVLGPPQLMLGGLSLSGKTQRVVYAYRCTQCSHLELFAGEPAT